MWNTFIFFLSPRRVKEKKANFYRSYAKEEVAPDMCKNILVHAKTNFLFSLFSLSISRLLYFFSFLFFYPSLLVETLNRFIRAISAAVTLNHNNDDKGVRIERYIRIENSFGRREINTLLYKSRVRFHCDVC